MQILNVTGGLSGDSFLFKTKETAILFDTAGQKDAEKLVKNLEYVLKDRELDYIFLTHSHYDHVGGVPYIREKYKNVKVVSSEYAKKILDKDTAKKAILDMGTTDEFTPKYNQDLMKSDIIIKDIEIFSAKDIKIQAFEALGHTKCSLIFLVNDEILIANESVGPMTKAGDVECACLLSFSDCLKSIEKASKIPCKYVIAPHHGIVKNKEQYFIDCKNETKKTRDFINQKIDENLEYNEILDKFTEHFYTEKRRVQMPKKAFLANNSVAIQKLMQLRELTKTEK